MFSKQFVCAILAKRRHTIMIGIDLRSFSTKTGKRIKRSNQLDPFQIYIPNPILPSGTTSFLLVLLTTTVFWVTHSSQVITFGPWTITALGVVRLTIGLWPTCKCARWFAGMWIYPDQLEFIPSYPQHPTLGDKPYPSPPGKIFSAVGSAEGSVVQTFPPLTN